MKLANLRQVFFLLIFLPLASFATDDANALLIRGNNYYAKGQFKEALSSYKLILADDYESPVVYFNMGDASFKLGEIPAALLYFERARKLSPNDENIQFNIRLANSKIKDKVTQVPRFFLSEWWDALVFVVSANAWAVWTVILVFIASGLLIVYFLAKERVIKKTAFYVAISLFLLGALTIVFSASQREYLKNNQEAIVFSNMVTIKGEAGDQGKALFVIHAGTKVKLEARSKAWVKIVLGNGNGGWMKMSDLQEI